VPASTKAQTALAEHLEKRGKVQGRQSAKALAEQSEAFNARNIELFTRMNELNGTITPLLAKELVAPRDAVEIRALRRLTRQLDAVMTDIVQTNYGLVRGYVRRFTSNTSAEDSQDFENAGVVGLMRAIATYDINKGKFGQWAFKPIQREVLRAVRDADHPNMNPGDFEKRADILKAVKKLVKDHGDDYKYTHEEVSALSGTSLEQVGRVLNAPRLDSLAQPIGDAAGTTLGDTIEDPHEDLEDAVMARISITALENYGLVVLDPRELFVVVRRFGLDGEPRQRLSAIGEILGLSREAVRQVEAKAIAKIQHPSVLRSLVHAGR
jgi:RNA polymerase primary sigma factor/RNA polymerase nonessential primary-like sigma factor